VLRLLLLPTLGCGANWWREPLVVVVVMVVSDARARDTRGGGGRAP
jgi:hypothetical protein